MCLLYLSTINGTFKKAISYRLYNYLLCISLFIISENKITSLPIYLLWIHDTYIDCIILYIDWLLLPLFNIIKVNLPMEIHLHTWSHYLKHNFARYNISHCGFTKVERTVLHNRTNNDIIGNIDFAGCFDLTALLEYPDQKIWNIKLTRKLIC